LLKKCVIFLSLIFCFTCSGAGPSAFLSNENKTIYKRSACDPKKPFPQMILIPFFESASQIIPNCQTYPKQETALAFFIFYHQWLEYFEDRDMAVRDMLENVMVEWDTKMREVQGGYDIKGEPYEDRKIIGLVKSNSIIWVWEGYNHRMAESALIHELVHLAIRAKYGTHGDPDHEGPKYRGWTPAHSAMIVETKQMLRAFNL